jgi:hypothetical protein
MGCQEVEVIDTGMQVVARPVQWIINQRSRPVSVEQQGISEIPSKKCEYNRTKEASYN